MSRGVYAYFSLSFKEIVLNDDISKSQAKRLDGFSKKAEKFRAFLIGQIGKNTAIENNPITLNNILDHIYPILLQAQDAVGGRVILIECEDEEKLLNLYQANNFNILQKQDLVQMYMIFDSSNT